MREMDATAGKTKTFWLETEEMPQFETLSKDLTSDVVVVGAGISGLSVAYSALKKGLSVIVLEDGQIASGETGRTSAHLSSALDDRFYNLETYHGKEGSRLAAESHAAAIDWIEHLCRAEKIDCDFKRVDGYLFASSNDYSELEKEYEAVKRTALKIEWAKSAPWPSYNTGKCLVFHDQAQFHPGRYLAGLTKAVVKAGGQIFAHTHVTKTEGGDEPRVETKSGRQIKTKHIVVATNSPINESMMVHTKQAAYRTYVIGGVVPAGTIPQALYWDTEDPYHYIRVAPLDASSSEELLIVGGADHKTGQPPEGEDPFEKLESWARTRLPEIKKIAYRWSGQVLEPVDGLAFIGQSPSKTNVYFVTGDSGHGLTHGTIAGLLLVDLITKKKNPWEELYSPSRVHVSAGVDLIKENANSVSQYLDWLTPGDVKEVEQIAPGEGAVLRSGLKKVAVYRNTNGGLYAMSAVCPHLEAIVTWNSKEKTWDCPAHGSRFSPHGEPLNGPAISTLKAISKLSI